MNILKVLSILWCLLAISCAAPVATVKLVKPVDNESIVYVYRPRVLANSMVLPELIINGEKISKIENGSYQIFHLPVQRHVISLEVADRYLGDKTIKLNTLPNQFYFLRLVSRLKFQKNKPYIRHLYLEQVSESDAYFELLQLADNKLAISATKEDSGATNDDSEAKFSILKTNNPFYK